MIKVYYCRSMDGEDPKEVVKEYDMVEVELNRRGFSLVNSFKQKTHTLYSIKTATDKKKMTKAIVAENLANLAKSDCVIVNVSKLNHPYVGCYGEMFKGHEMGKRVITIIGANEYDYHDACYLWHHSDVIVGTLEEALNLTDSKTIDTSRFQRVRSANTACFKLLY